MSNKNQNKHLDGVIRVFGEGIKISMGGPGEPAFSKSAFRKAINETINYLVNGGQVGLAGTVYSVPRLTLEITAVIGAEAPASTWGILMARQQGVEKHAVVDVPKPDADSFYTGNQVGDVSRETVRNAIKDHWNPPIVAGDSGHGKSVPWDGEPSGTESNPTSEGPGQEETAVPGVVKNQDPLARF